MREDQDHSFHRLFFYCKLCARVFLRNCELDEHMTQLHPDWLPFMIITCSNCQMTFSTRMKLHLSDGRCTGKGGDSSAIVGIKRRLDLRYSVSDDERHAPRNKKPKRAACPDPKIKMLNFGIKGERWA